MAVPDTTDQIVTRSCEGCWHGKAGWSGCTYAPFRKAEDVSAIWGPFRLYETLCAGVDAGRPGLVAKLEGLHEAGFGGGCEKVLRVRGPACVGYGVVWWDGPGAGDLEGVRATDDEDVLDGIEDEVCAGAEADNVRRLSVDLCKVHQSAQP